MRLSLRKLKIPLLVASALTIGMALPIAPSAEAIETPLGPVGVPVITRCEPNIVIIVPGGASTVKGMPENLPIGGFTADLGNRLDQFGKSTIRTVSYDSGAFVALKYRDSAIDAAARTSELVGRTAAECPDAMISLYGYSLGADAAAHVASDIGQGRGPIPAKRLSSAVLMASPYRGSSTVQGGTAGPGEGILGDLSSSYGSVSGRIMDVCDQGDYICDSNTNTDGVRANSDTFLGVSAVEGSSEDTRVVPNQDRRTIAREYVDSVVPGQFYHTGGYALSGSFYRGEGFLRDHMV